MNAKILVVDDNANNRRLLVDILEDEDYTVFTAENGLQVLEMSQKLKPDIILLDIMMPGLDGFGVCSSLKSEPLTKDIPIIMVTAKTDSRDIKSSLELGAFDYIKKPIDEIEVIARVQSALRFKNHENQLREMAMKDGLTGIYNRSLLMELLEKEMIKGERMENPIAFVMLDIDHFKSINDTYGHMVGDMVLKKMAVHLNEVARKSDIVGRYGGEEFSIILPNVDREDAYQICERLRKAIENLEFITEKGRFHITVSFGVYVKNKDEAITHEEMVKRADEALYRAKNNGRNRVEIF
ncbi:MAG: diguanylate cyclase [Thermotaleaceae bacterium]